MSTYFDLIMIPLQLLIVFFTIYYFTLSFFGLFGRRPEEKIYDEQKTFAMIVCAVRGGVRCAAGYGELDF